jgi:hypothetical protein
VFVEPKLPSLREFIKQYNAKVAAGQFLKGKGVKDRKLKMPVMTRLAQTPEHEVPQEDVESPKARSPNAEQPELLGESTTSRGDPNGNGDGTTIPAQPPTPIADVPPPPPDAPPSVEDQIKRPEPIVQRVLVDWEDVWKGGQIIDDEEEADAQANS